MPRGGPGGETFEYGGYWLGTESSSDAFYRYWYEQRGRKIRRRSLGTSDWEEAKRALITHVQVNEAPKGQEPESVFLAVLMERYFLDVTDKKASADDARAAGKLMLDYFGPEAKFADITIDKQREFMRAFDDKGHAVGTISRNLSVLSAAKNHALRAEIIRSAQPVLYAPGTVAEILDKEAPKNREWVPTVKQLGELFDYLNEDPRAEHLFWYTIAALNTGARPDAILGLTAEQFDWAHRTIALNPPGRRQEPKKFRPTIKSPLCLWGWAQHRKGWKLWVGYGKKERRLTNMKNFGRRVRESLGWSEFVPYTLRHFVATQTYDRMRRAGIVDAKQQTAYLLGHTGELKSTTDRYIKYSADFMSDTVRAIDDMMVEIQDHTRKQLFAPKMHPRQGMMVVHGGGQNVQ